MPDRTILVTGASGYVASQLLPQLSDLYDCRLTDARTGRPGGPEVLAADLTTDDLEAIRPLFGGVDTVVHLAYLAPSKEIGSRSPASYRIERRNVDMAFNVYQLALEEGVRRVVMASSNHAADWYEDLIHRRLKHIVDPWERAVADNFYGWAKEAYEHMGFVYACGKMGRQLEVVQIRIGAPRPIEAARYGENLIWYHRDLGAYVSPRDLTQLTVKSIETPDIRDRWGIPFQIFYGISDNTRKFWSIANAREVVGYSPEDDSEVTWADDIRRILLDTGRPIPASAFNPGPGTA